MPIAARILGKTSQIVVQGGKTANQIGHNQAALIAGPNFGGRMDCFAPGTLLLVPFGGESACFAPGRPLLVPFGGESACFAPGTPLFVSFGGGSACFAPGTPLFAPEWVQVGDDIDEGGYSRKNIATPVILRMTPRISLALTFCL